MKIVFTLLALWACIKTISYGMLEIKQHQNKPGGIVVIGVAILSFVFPVITVWIR